MTLSILRETDGDLEHPKKESTITFGDNTTIQLVKVWGSTLRNKAIRNTSLVNVTLPAHARITISTTPQDPGGERGRNRGELNPGFQNAVIGLKATRYKTQHPTHSFNITLDTGEFLSVNDNGLVTTFNAQPRGADKAIITARSELSVHFHEWNKAINITAPKPNKIKRTNKPTKSNTKPNPHGA